MAALLVGWVTLCWLARCLHCTGRVNGEVTYSALLQRRADITPTVSISSHRLYLPIGHFLKLYESITHYVREHFIYKLNMLIIILFNYFVNNCLTKKLFKISYLSKMSCEKSEFPILLWKSNANATN